MRELSSHFTTVSDWLWAREAHDDPNAAVRRVLLGEKQSVRLNPGEQDAQSHCEAAIYGGLIL